MTLTRDDLEKQLAWELEAMGIISSMPREELREMLTKQTEMECAVRGVAFDPARIPTMLDCVMAQQRRITTVKGLLENARG